MNQFIDQQIEETKQEIRARQALLVDLKAQKTKTNGTNDIEKWLGFHFQSSSGLTGEFAGFYRDIKKHLTQVLRDDFEIVSFSRGHFEFSGFVKNKESGKLIYFSASDVRFWPDEWHEHLLIRTAQHDKDYTGGTNCYTTIPEIKDSLLDLTGA